MRKILLGALVLLSVMAVWQFISKQNVLQPARLAEAWEEVRASSSAVAASTKVQASPEATQEPDGPPVADPAPDIPPATDGEMFPFPADVPLLMTTVSLPAKKVPLVYFTPCGNSSDSFTSASKYFGEFLDFQIRRVGPSGLMMNILPSSKILLKTYRSYADRSKQLTYDAYLSDAGDIGADILIYPVFDGTTSQPVVTVKFVDFQTSQTETWSSEEAGLTSVNRIIIAAATKALQFAGYSQDQIDEANIEKGAPSDSTFAWYSSTAEDDMTYENLFKVAQADPEFEYVYTHDAGTTWVGQLIDKGLRKYPNDSRLIARKAVALSDAGCTAALVRYVSELIRRYPDDCMTYYAFTERMEDVFPARGNSKETPQVYKAMIQQLGVFADYHPKCYAYTWDYAYALKTLAGYIRGTHTTDKIPDHIWPERSQYIQEAYETMERLVKSYPDNASLLAAFAYFTADVVSMSVHDQLRFIEKVHALDPRDTSAEMCFISLNGIGYGTQRDYFTLVDTAFKHHAGDPKATADIAGAVRFELFRRIGWKEMTTEQAYTPGNPWINRVMDAADFVYSTGGNLSFDNDWAYYLATEKKGDSKKIDEWRTTGQNSYVAALVAYEEYQAQNWEKCAKFAKLAMPHMLNNEKGEINRYYLVKSLWKMKKYEESLRESRKGIFRYPSRQTFPYMYAVVALEAGIDLDTAYECAYRAVELDTSNPGCNETFEKLRLRLGKPPHPALASVSN